MLRIFLAMLAALYGVASSAVAETPLERGSYLMNAVMVCDGCHTPRGPGAVAIPSGISVARRLSGGVEVWDTPAYTVRGSNITPDRDTGIGTWREDDIKRLLTQGIRPDGVRVAPQMPYNFYRILTPRDLNAVTSYLKTIKPVSNRMPPPVYKAAVTAAPLPGAETSIGETVPTEPVARGFYLATLANCMGCHSRRPDGVPDFRNWWGKGGFKIKGDFGSVVVSNISSDRQRGVGATTDAELKRALTEGIGHDGRLLKMPMARQAYLSRMTGQDLNAVIAWIRTIPPKD